jgi:hypothetical protein
MHERTVRIRKTSLIMKVSFGLKKILEEKKNEFSPHLRIPPFF